MRRAVIAVAPGACASFMRAAPIWTRSGFLYLGVGSAGSCLCPSGGDLAGDRVIPKARTIPTTYRGG